MASLDTRHSTLDTRHSTLDTRHTFLKSETLFSLFSFSSCIYPNILYNVSFFIHTILLYIYPTDIYDIYEYSTLERTSLVHLYILLLLKEVCLMVRWCSGTLQCHLGKRRKAGAGRRIKKKSQKNVFFFFTSSLSFYLLLLLLLLLLLFSFIFIILIFFFLSRRRNDI